MLVDAIRSKNSIQAYKQLERKNPFQMVVWGGIMGCTENVAFENLVAEVIEESSGYQLTRRSMHLRALALKLGELYWSFGYLQTLFSRFHDKALEGQFAYLKTLVADIFEHWSGSRDIPRLICLGGVRKDLKLGDQKFLRQSFETISKELDSVISFCLFDRVIKENLDDLDYSFSERQLHSIMSWESLNSKVSLESLESVKSFLSKEQFNKMLQRQAEGDFKSLFYGIFIARILRVLQDLEEAKASLKTLPEGEYRIAIDHLHIPGGHFIHKKVMAPSGSVYAYFCSGKLRIRSFSTHILGLLEKGIIAKDDRQGILLAVLGVDPIQGVLCETSD